jgi:EAL domain-containing protein (putative c-di-GMP-specific phosphodiesterase class I)
VSIALDDFGTGYASLTHLKRFPVDMIKIDRSFVSDIEVDAGDAAIVKAVLSLGQSLGIRVVAEGVETAAQASFLREHGCDLGQGYYFGRPIPAGEVPQLVASQKQVAR